MIKSEYDQIVRENFDLSDNYTRHYIATLEDAEQTQLMSALSSALYDQIIAKVDEIDFGSIPMSRGDITKVEGFSRTEECIDIIRKLIIQYKEKTDTVDVIISAVNNIKERKPQFTKAYVVNSEFPMMLYNLIVLSIERSVSFIISTCIEYVKDPKTNSMEMAIDKVAYKNTADDMMFNQLKSFNNLCKNKSIDKMLDTSLHVTNESFNRLFEEFDSNYTEEVPNYTNPSSTDPIVDEEGFDPFEEPEDIDEKPEDDISNSIDDLTGEIDNDVSSMFDDDDSIEDTVEPENIPVQNPTDDEDEVKNPLSLSEDEINEGGIVIDKELVKSAAKAAGYGAKNIYNSVKNKIPERGYKIIKAFALTGGGIFLLIKVIIPTIKALIYEFMYTSMKFSDYLEIQAQLIEAHANEGEENGDISSKTAKKQRKWAERFKKWSNIFSLDKKQAQNKAKAQNDKDKKHKKKVSKDDDGDDALF